MFNHLEGNRPMLYFLGSGLLLMSLFFMVVIFEKPELYAMQLVLGIHMILMGIQNRDELLDERVVALSNRAFKTSYMVTLLTGMLFFTLYTFGLITIKAESAIVIILAIMFLSFSVSNFMLWRKY
ncbi:hypothetical protein ETI06_10185 [Macrococcoides goetzii]|nr:hypothetical protein [Macrococcus goetzii]TDM39334.1 hypothetical protein ETI10_11045 [Macrococcus goetzii]TDM44201.1 hypothetical protein ETI08_10580 [Macrococcus goetzii]TDM47289.1 hypothetical protein ETI06_10185 [Macrococcus goetzii]